MVNFVLLDADMFFPFIRKVVKEFLQGKEHFNNIYLAFDTWRKKMADPSQIRCLDSISAI